MSRSISQFTELLLDGSGLKINLRTVRMARHLIGRYSKKVLPQTLYQRDVSDSAFLTTYHSLHIQHLKRSS